MGDSALPSPSLVFLQVHSDVHKLGPMWKRFCTLPSVTSQEPGIQTYEPVGDSSHSNYGTLSFFWMLDYLDLAIRILFQQLLYISDTLSSLQKKMTISVSGTRHSRFISCVPSTDLENHHLLMCPISFQQRTISRSQEQARREYGYCQALMSFVGSLILVFICTCDAVG